MLKLQFLHIGTDGRATVTIDDGSEAVTYHCTVDDVRSFSASLQARLVTASEYQPYLFKAPRERRPRLSAPEWIIVALGGTAFGFALAALLL